MKQALSNSLIIAVQVWMHLVISQQQLVPTIIAAKTATSTGIRNKNACGHVHLLEEMLLPERVNLHCLWLISEQLPGQ